MKVRRRIAAPKAQGLCGPCYGLTQLQQGFTPGRMGPTLHFAWQQSPGRNALGQKQAFEVVFAMSALPPKADMDQCRRDVRFVPIADSCTAAIDLIASAAPSRGSCHIPPELATHFCFFKWNVHPIGSRKQGD